MFYSFKNKIIELKNNNDNDKNDIPIDKIISINKIIIIIYDYYYKIFNYLFQ